MTIPPELLDLAPDHLPNRHRYRFDGSGFEVPLARFAAADRAALARIYAAVQELAALRRGMGPAPDFAALEPHLARVAGADLMADAQALGRATPRGGPDDPVRKAVHDVRGGGLTVLLGGAELAALRPGDRDLVRQCVLAAGAHAKIMRALVPELDPTGRADDLRFRPHGVETYRVKWDGARVPGPLGAVTVTVRCSFAGNVAERCLESAAIDRVVYNYVNNAVRFATGGRVTLWVFPVGADLVRWVVENGVDAGQEAFLAAEAPDPAALFAGGVTNGGTGVGLRACAEVVAECFGLDGPAEAVRAGHLGARAGGSQFRAWFHWPVARV